MMGVNADDLEKLEKHFKEHGSLDDVKEVIDKLYGEPKPVPEPVPGPPPPIDPPLPTALAGGACAAAAGGLVGIGTEKVLVAEGARHPTAVAGGIVAAGLTGAAVGAMLGGPVGAAIGACGGMLISFFATV